MSCASTTIFPEMSASETVIFTLREGNADFPYIASDYHLPILPAKDDGSADWQSGNWTGAFTLEEFEPGVSARMIRNPNYFKEGQPYFDEVEFIAIPEDFITNNTFAGRDGKTLFITGPADKVTAIRMKVKGAQNWCPKHKRKHRH